MRGIKAAGLSLTMLVAVADEALPQLFPARRIFSSFAWTAISDIGDADGDGLPDLLTTPPGTLGSGVLILRASAAGGFWPPVLIEGVGHSETQHAADVNGDGIPDLVSTIYEVTTVQPGFGGLQFGLPVVTPTPNAYYFEPLFADLNGDGRTDIVLTPALGQESLQFIYFGQADCTLLQAPNVAAGGVFKHHELQDVDRDGVLDIVGVQGLSSNLRAVVLLGIGDGKFGDPIKTKVTGGSFSFVAPGAQTSLSDGTPDLAIIGDALQTGERFIILMRGVADGTFLPAGNFQSPPEDSILEIGDMDADGLPDLVCGESVNPVAGNAGTLHVWRNAGAFAFTSEPRALVGGQPGKLFVLDEDHDGLLDVVIGNWPGNSSASTSAGSGVAGPDLTTGQPSGSADFSLIRGRGDGSFASAGEVLAGAPVEDLVVTDLNGDGRADLAMRCQGDAPQLRFAAGNGDGTFGPAIDVAGVTPTAFLVIKDLDRDGDDDLVFEELDGLRIQLGTGLLDAAGVPAFAAPQLIGPGGIDALGVADLDGDGALDIVAVRSATQALTVQAGVGDGTFLPAVTWSCGMAASALAIADVTSDGRPDLLLGSTTDNRLVVLLGQSGGFSAPVITELLFPHDRIATADLDADGLLDVVLASSATKGLTQLRGLGSGLFAAVAAPTTIGAVWAMAFADVTGDTLPDLLATHLVQQALTVWPGLPDGSLGTPQYFYTKVLPTCLAADDLDGDGLLDVVTGCHDGSAWILVNQLSEWIDLGGALAASFGTPHLDASGPLAVGQTVSMLASGVPTPTFGVLIIGFGTSYLPYAGGTIVPTPDIAVELQPDQPLTETWPSGYPPGTPVCVQAWFATPSPRGTELSASRALLAHTP